MENKDYNQIYRDYVQQSQQNVISEEKESQEMGKEKIVAVRKNNDGDLIAFKTETGRELDYVTALNEAKSGNLAHVDVFHKYGRDILRSEPDGIKENNLDQLPQF
jgi:predicted metal-dependent peptidase